ncbi:MAG TPA: hypothetical protein PKA80_05575 [Ignavibacteriaceae bacterium]|nr:hypothetical protein [Ignavibacteriaceae bacterium]
MNARHFISRITILIVAVSISGCYTVLWTPEDRMPSDSDYESVTEFNNSFGYGDPLLFGYGYYYSYPWWYDLHYSPNNSTQIENNSEDIESLRNSGNGRNTETGRTLIVDTPPPSKPSNSNSGSNTNTNSGTTTQTENSSSRSQNSGNDNSIRNDNGSRNSEGKRK